MTAPTPLQIPQLCLPDDVQARCVRTLSAQELIRASALISEASMKIRSYTKRTFAKGQITQTLRAMSNFIVLQQVPVVSVDAISLIDYLGNVYPVPSFGFDGIDRINLSFYRFILNLPAELLSFGTTWTGSAKVTYTFGYASIPPEISSKCAELVARLFNTPGAGVVGVDLERIGPYEARVNMGTGQIAGVIRLTDDDKDDLADFRRVGSTIEMLT